MTDEEWVKSIEERVDSWFANATDEDIRELLEKANFEFYQSVANIGILDD